MRTTRRSFLSLLAVVSVVGCHKPASSDRNDPAPAASTSASAVTSSPKPPTDKELLLFAWSEYVPQTVLDGFEKETGIKVRYETFSSNEEMLSKIGAGATGYDVIQPSDYIVEMLSKKGSLAKLDKSKLPNMSQVGQAFRGLPYDPDLSWSVPYMAGAVGIVVNVEKVKEPIRGYKDVFTPAHKGRIVVVNDNREIVSWAMRTAGIDVNAPSPENLAKVKGTLQKWLPLIKVYDSDSPKTPLLNGDVDIGVIWSGEAATLINTDAKRFHFALPEEGAHLFVDSLCIMANAPHKEAAHMFLNYVLRPEVGKAISEKFPYTNPSDGARKLLSPEALRNPASYPPIEKLITFRDIGKAASDIDRLMTDLKASN